MWSVYLALAHCPSDCGPHSVAVHMRRDRPLRRRLLLPFFLFFSFFRATDREAPWMNKLEIAKFFELLQQRDAYHWLKHVSSMNFKKYEENNRNWAETVSKIEIGTNLCTLAKVKLIVQKASSHQGDTVQVQRWRLWSSIVVFHQITNRERK
jgi:hypothetical protein